MNRVVAAARLHLIHPMVALGIAWLVVGISFAINWAIWFFADLQHQANDGGFTGGVVSLYITVAIVYVQAVTQMLPFAMGLSLSRRTFYLGTALMGVVQAVLYGVILAVLVAIEGATDGWGVGLHFWAPAGLDVDNFALQVLVSGAPMLAFIACGAGIGVVHKRWGTAGTWGLILGSLVVIGGLVVLVTALGAWTQVGGWFADRSVVTLAVALPAALAVVFAGLTWTGLRRTVP
ncbi:hypothetical protein [Petropleomorpha daqingensis]|uniref:ABC-2 type transport system permease protein n=1 Tax=Petropleomorpha daqingensis TaxID=2026353 RepID=A0A853CEP0_9ACTN|nr:hypothetical protein [Petropleomorpha daqingensis]NYJ05626.1 hypothetical protein [Petropleomorpha daqingensis]